MKIKNKIFVFGCLGFIFLTATLSCKQSTKKVVEIQEPKYNDTTQWYISNRNAQADIFYIISTEIGDYTDKEGNLRHHADTYSDSLRAPMYGEMKGVDALIGENFNFYSPYYRQCSLQTYAVDSLVDARMPMSIQDIKKAFKYYTENINPSRPFILAGYSQGAMILTEILKEIDDKTFSRMIAAYVIGATIDSVSAKNYPHIIPAQKADDLGVTICYNSVKNPDCALNILRKSAVCINPVNWTTDSTSATIITKSSFHTEKVDTLTIKIDGKSGLMCVDGFTATDYILPVIGKEGNYHSREIWLYRDYLKQNMELRSKKYQDK